MHDPLTVALEIKYPWKCKPNQFWPKGYRSTFITIWHKDPCKDGSDNSCDWWGSNRKLNKKEKAITDAVWGLETILDNRPFWPDHPAHKRFQDVKDSIIEWRKRPKVRWPVRWHFWHWRIQIHPLQQLIRWLFERCCFCKKGYYWNESIAGNWGGTKSWHMGCDKTAIVKVDKKGNKS